MRRFANARTDLFSPDQPDLFTSAPQSPDQSRPPPLAELAELVAKLRATEIPPWPDAAAAMPEERRALGLARIAGPEGDKLAAAILNETERLLAVADRAAVAS
jgi:hypothetical protein